MVGECSSLEPCLSSSPDRDSPVPDDSINGCNYILTYVTNYYIDGTEWDGLCRGRVGRGGVRRKGNRKSTVPASRLFCFPLLSSAFLCFTLLYSALLYSALPCSHLRRARRRRRRQRQARSTQYILLRSRWVVGSSRYIKGWSADDEDCARARALCVRCACVGCVTLRSGDGLRVPGGE